MYQIEVESEIEGGSSCCVRIVNRRDVYLTEFDASFPDSTSHQIVMAALQAVMLLSSSACPICLGKILSRQTVILMPNPWLCFWVNRLNTPLGKQLNICLKRVIQISCILFKCMFAYNFVFVFCKRAFDLFHTVLLVTFDRSSHWS
uniref:uncharacterized protein LOC105350541 isoform X1 n=1 Tax=Fragaria vesca subsp. vesca TaxID=101020 RepID=UPI0005CA2B67|nr:PREDICTED: uncharacterized protein LOC105350541 isoform X1 [Fragaria vesca subsp. vesca]